MNLEQFGWSGFFARQRAAGIPARVASACREQFVVWTEGGAVDAEPSGALRFESPLWPAVGDWVTLREDGLVIERVLERRTTLRPDNRAARRTSRCWRRTSTWCSS